MSEATTTRTLELEAHPGSASVARAFVRDLLDDGGAGDLVDVACLLTSELVTNAVLYGLGPIALTVLLTGPVLRVEVGDCDTHLPRRREVTAESTSGRGLSMVEHLATDWGSYAVEGGKRVWFEMAR